MPKLNLLRFSLLWPILAVLLLCYACKDPVMEEVDPCEIEPCNEDTLMGKLDTLWTAKIRPDLSYGLHKGLILAGDNIIYNHVLNIGYGVNFYNAEDGELWKTWDEYPISYFADIAYHVESDRIVLKYFGSIAVLEASNGEVEYTYDSNAANPFGQLLGDYYYYTRQNSGATSAWIVRSHINDFSNWETVYTIHTNDVGGSRPNIQSYNLWTDPATGDEILIFQHRMAFPNRVDVVAWNMTKGELLWKHDDIEPHGNSSTQQIFLHDNKAYFQGQNTLWCFAMGDGEILWYDQYLSPIRSFMNGNVVYGELEDKIFVNADGDYFVAYYPNTGQKYFTKTGVGLSGAKMSYHNGILYYTTIFETGAKLVAMRAATGQLLWEERSNLNFHSQFSGPVAIDPERGVLYASDRYYLMAIKLYED